MKKLLFAPCALLMCWAMAACSDKGKDGDKEKEDKNPIAEVEDFIEDITDNSSDWSVKEWKSRIMDLGEAMLAFWESEPSKDDIKELDKLQNEFQKAIMEAANGSNKEVLEQVFKELEEDSDFKQLDKKINKAEKKARKKAKMDDDDVEYD